MTAAAIKESLERTAATDATDKESMLNFSLRVFNRMSLDKEGSRGLRQEVSSAFDIGLKLLFASLMVTMLSTINCENSS